MSIADLKVKISGNADEFDSAMKNMQKKFDRTVRKMERKGRQMTQSITLPILALGGAAVKSAIDFEDAFAGVRKTVDATESEFANIREGILNMSKVMPTSAEEIAGVAEAAGQLGIKTGAILDFSKTMVMLGDTTNMAAQEAATSLARIANVMETPQDQFDRMGSTIVDLGNNFATTEAEITDFAQRISGAAKIAGFAEADIFALGTAFSSVGVEAGLGGTAVQKVMIGINTAVAEGSEKLAQFANVAGMGAAEFQKAWQEDAGQAFASFVNGLGKQGDQAAGVLDDLGLADQRLMRAFLSLANAGDLVNRTLDVGRKAWEDNNALAEEANKRYKTVASRLKMLWNRIKALGVSIGDALMPAIERAIGFVVDLTQKFENLSSTAKSRILLIAGLLAAGGPLLMAFAKVAKAIKVLSAIATSKFTLMVAAVGLVITIGKNMVDNWDAIKADMTHLWRGLVNVFMQGKKEIALALNNVGLISDKQFTKVSEAAAQASFKFKLAGMKADQARKGWVGIGESFQDLMGDIGSLIGESTGLNSVLSSWSQGFDTFNNKVLTASERIERLKEKYDEMFGKTVDRAELPEHQVAPIQQPGGTLQRAKQQYESIAEAAGLMGEKASGALQFTKSIALDFTNSFGQGITNVIVAGERLIDTLKNIGKLLLSSVIQKGIGLLLTGGLSGVTGFFGSGGGLFGALFGRDIGGPVSADKPYLIGKGPHQELFIPDRSGSIVPNSRMRNMGGGLADLRIHVTGEMKGQGKDLVGVIKGASYSISR